MFKTEAQCGDRQPGRERGRLPGARADAGRWFLPATVPAAKVKRGRGKGGQTVPRGGRLALPDL